MPWCALVRTLGMLNTAASLPLTLLSFNPFSMLRGGIAKFPRTCLWQALLRTLFIGSLFNSVYRSPFPLRSNVSLGWLRYAWYSFCGIWTLAYPQGPPFEFPLAISWSLPLSSLLRTKLATVPMFTARLGTVFNSPCAWNYKPSHLASPGVTGPIIPPAGL